MNVVDLAFPANKIGDKPLQKVVDILVDQLRDCGKTQAQIASEVGFDKPNVVTMIKQGKTKVPLAKIGPLAISLGIDPIAFFAVVMGEYYPETWDSIKALRHQPLLTNNELDVLEAMRELNALPIVRLSPLGKSKLARLISEAHLS